MPTSHRAGARPRPLHHAAALAAAAAVLLAACSSDQSASPRISTAPSGSGIAQASRQPTPTPAPTPPPTPRYTNPPDEELAALIPRELAGTTIVVPPPTDFAYTPGDFGEAYGELGLRFTALQVAYVPTPRLSLYAARVEGPPVATEELEPHLETAGRYVGIAGQVREPWELVTVGDRVTWVRPEDDATAAGTMIYTWAAGEYVFLLIGVDDTLNRALFAALPGEAAPTPSPRPSRSPAPSGSAAPTAAASAEPG